MGQKDDKKISKGTRKSDAIDVETTTQITLFRLRKKLIGLSNLLNELSYLPYEIAAVGSEGVLEPFVLSKLTYNQFVEKSLPELDNARRLFVVSLSLKKIVKNTGDNHTVWFQSEKISINDANELLENLRLEHKFLIELGRNRQKMLDNIAGLTKQLESQRELDASRGIGQEDKPTNVVNYTLIELPNLDGKQLLELIKKQEEKIDELQDLLTEAEAGIVVTVANNLLS